MYVCMYVCMYTHTQCTHARSAVFCHPQAWQPQNKDEPALLELLENSSFVRTHSPSLKFPFRVVGTTARLLL